MFSLVNCQLKPSRTLITIYIGVLLCGSSALLITQIGLFQKLIIGMVLAGGLSVMAYTKGMLRSPYSITAFSWSADKGHIKIFLRNGRQFEVTSVQQRVVTPLFVLLRVRVKEQLFSQSLLVFHDSCSSESFRRLKVLTRWAGNKLED